jgi:hypothetical protein
VAGLTRDDFEIYDSAKRPAVTIFSVQKFNARRATAPESEPPPRFVALCSMI